MKVNFTYDKEKDIWCLLNYGKKSDNSKDGTRQYIELVEKYGENPTQENTSDFIDEHIKEKNLNIDEKIKYFQEEWNNFSDEFQKIAGRVFDISLPENIIAYGAINNRCPYSIGGNYFFVYLHSKSIRLTAMHELWHFYTWYAFGLQEEILGKQKYNDIKELLTVLLNTECKDLLPEGVQDMGYPQHQEMREKIIKYWEKDKNIKNLWNHLVK